MSTPILTHQVIRASAGSGKTFRLTNRYIALISQGVSPAHIWAATFTRKAAGEILDRIVERLAEAACDAGKAKALADQIGRPECAATEFAEHLRILLANLHRLRIGTLDSLFLLLASTFSLELGLPPGWAICDETDAANDRESALDALLTADPSQLAGLIALYERLTQGMTKRGIRDDLMERVKELFEAYHAVKRHGWQTQPPSPPTETLEDLLAEIDAVDLLADKQLMKVRNEDVHRARSKQWEKVVSTGLAAKVLKGELTFNNKSIPSQLIDLLKKLNALAGSAILTGYYEETAAAWELLDQFHRHLAAIQQASGALRFDDITRALAAGLDQLPDGFDYRIDGRIGHLLLDEFQDTSTSQWNVLKRLASKAMVSGTFFGVGDIKQAIYGWRGGRAALLERLPAELSISDTCIIDMDQSRRSAQSVVDVVNAVYQNLVGCVEKEEACAAAQDWQKRFRTHTTARAIVAGYCQVETGLKREDEEPVTDYRGRHYHWVAKKIAILVREKSAATVGVLCRKNDTVGRMIYELRRAGVSASEEGGNPVTDSPAVDVILSMFKLADHPSDSIAAFHLKHCPLARALVELEFDPDAPNEFSRRVREELLASGYGPFVAKWAKRLASLCSISDRVRLDQLVALADEYQPRGNLRASAFVAWVREQKVAASSSCRVRVLTLHKAKGLEFDAVVLPELDVPLRGRSRAFVVADPDPPELPHGFVGRRLSSSLRPLADPLTIEQCAAADRREIEESLCLLYVALTRARDGLYIFPPGPFGKKKRTDEWDTVVLKALCADAADSKQRKDATVVFRTGDPAWQPDRRETPVAVTTASERKIRFAASDARRRRIEWLSPSQLEGGGRVNVSRMFDSHESTRRQIGSLYHAWFATIQWLDQKEPTDDELIEVAQKVEAWAGQDGLVEDQIRQFRAVLRKPAVRALFSRTTNSTAFRVETERAFAIRDGEQILNGSIDRLVWSRDGNGLVTAEVIDFKTDEVPIEAKSERVAYYRPQIEAYRHAVSVMAAIPIESVRASLVFTALDCVVPVPLNNA